MAIAVSICFLLTGCDDYPEVHPKLVDAKRARILHHEISDRKNVQFRATYWEKNVDLSDLDGNYCFKASELGHLNDWARRKASQDYQDQPTQ